MQIAGRVGNGTRVLAIPPWASVTVMTKRRVGWGTVVQLRCAHTHPSSVILTVSWSRVSILKRWPRRVEGWPLRVRWRRRRRSKASTLSGRDGRKHGKQRRVSRYDPPGVILYAELTVHLSSSTAVLYLCQEDLGTSLDASTSAMHARCQCVREDVRSTPSDDRPRSQCNALVSRFFFFLCGKLTEHLLQHHQ